MTHLRRRAPTRSLPAIAVAALLASGCHGPRAVKPAQAGLPTDVIALAAFDPAAVGPGAPPQPEPARALEVVGHGPQGRSTGTPEIHVRFNHPVVALGLADSAGLAGRFTIDPPLPGRVFWKSPELLVLEPFGAPRPGTRYTVSFDGAVGEGARPLTWTFETPRPTVVGSVPRSEPADPDSKDDEREAHPQNTPVIVEFDRPVTLEQARAHLRATARPRTGAALPHPIRVRPATRDEAPFRRREDEDAVRRNFVVQPRTPWPADSEVTVSVTPGLLAEEGPLPLDTPWSMVFRTPSPQAIVKLGCGPLTPCGLEPITLRLRNRVDADQLRKIAVSPRPKDLVISSPDDWGEGGREVVIEGQLVPGTTYTIFVPATLRDIHGQGIEGGATKLAVIAPRATLALSATSGILRPGPARTIGVESRHVTALHVRVGIYTDAELQAIALDSDPAALAFPARVLERRLPLTPSGQADWSSLALDLAELSGGAHRPVLVEVAAAELTPRARQYGPPGPVRGLFRLTDLGLAATTSLPASQVQVLRLSSGQPVPGARVYRSATTAPGPLLELGRTDASGLLALPSTFSPQSPAGSDPKSAPPLRLTVVDPTRDDHAHIDLAYFDRYHGPLRPGERVIARVIRERGVYRPGEKVRVVGWSAVDTPFSRSNLGRLATGTRVDFELVDHLKQVVATSRTRTTAEGKFWGELPIPARAALGRYSVHARLAGGRTSTSVKVEDYRVPEFAVEARVRRPDILIGEQTTIDLRASYFFGGPVPMSRVARTIDCQSQRFRPPGLEDSWEVGEASDHPPSTAADGHAARTFEPTPAGSTPGLHTLQIGGAPSQARHPQQCLVSAAVQDASMQEHGAEARFTVHPAAFYLAALPPPDPVAGLRVRVPLRAVSPAGERMAAAKVDVLVTRHWDEPRFTTEAGKRVVDRWVTRSATITHCTLDLPASGPDPDCALPPLLEGRYELAVSAAEPGSARVARTLSTFHVDPKVHTKADDWLAAPIEGLEVLLDHTRVQPGDTLEVAVRAPWPDARGNLVLARGGVRETHPLVLVNHEARFKFSVDDSWTPGINFHATVVAPAGPGRDRPTVERADALVYGGLEQRRLKVAVEAPDQARPGEAIALRVRVRDHQDRPIAARVALWAVDEAVLALTGYEVPDLLPDFVPSLWADIATRDDYARLLLPYIASRADPWYVDHPGRMLRRRSTRAPVARHGYAMTQDGPPPPSPPRTRFDTTPVFLADLAVDRSGEVRVTATLPDDLTTFRITAIASARLADGSAPGRFGHNDARTVVTAPLVLRAAMPRQLRPGDRAEVAAIVQNHTDHAGRLEVTANLVEATGTNDHALEFTSPPRVVAEVGEGGQARVVFAVRALAPGAPALELRASLAPTSGGAPIHDALRLPLPVAPERTLTERVAAHGSIAQDHAVEIPIKLPTAVLPAYGGVTIAATSSLLGGLEDAIHALVEYPYGCLEQSASRLLPIVALEQLGPDYPLGVPDTKEFMRSGVERILAMQTPSGGFGYWPGAPQVHAYASAYATWVLQRARAAGHPVPTDALKRALDDLARRVARPDLASAPIDRGSHDAIDVALALHALADAGRPVRDPAAQLYTVRQRLPAFARAFLLMAIHRDDPTAPEVRTLLAELLADIRELPGSASLHATVPGLEAVFDSDGRSDAILLMALLRVAPDHPLVDKLARGLLERRVGGAWRNTQENAYALLALVEHARLREARPPDFSARAWVGGANVLDTAFKGRDLAPRTSFTDMATILSMSAKPGDAPLPVVLARAGVGRLYYRIGAEWAPAQTDLPARAQGFTVTRNLRTTAGPATDAVTAGEAIAMDITVRSEVRVRHVVVDVPLPAGLEAVSHTLGLGRSASVLPGQRGWWVSHEEQRPDRVLVFADDLPPGTHMHTIDLRATSRGRFSFPPAKATAMYIPELHGRSVGATLEVR